MAFTINKNIQKLICSKTKKTLLEGLPQKPVGLCSCCPKPGSPVIVEYDLENISKGDVFSTRKGIFNYASLLPVSSTVASYADDVGGTPVILDNRLSQEANSEVWLKNEGTNPSGSFKDRGLCMGIALGYALGAKRFCLPTQGNAGVAASLFSARLGLPGCLVYMPEGYQEGVYHKAASFFGAKVSFFGKNIAAAGKKMREDFAKELTSGEYVDMSTFFEPGRLEGKKTMGLEIWSHFQNNLPDFIFYPTGGGTGLVGIWKAFTELRNLGLIPKTQKLPKMVAVQSEQCDPVVQAFSQKLDVVKPIESKGTIADGLDVPGAIMGHGMLRVLRESEGFAVAVSEKEIIAAFKHYGNLGINAGYESAATWASVKKLCAQNLIPKQSKILLLNTGSQLIPLAK